MRWAVFLLGCTSLSMVMAAPTYALAGDAEAAANLNIEEVVVTARKRTERLIDVPVAASALNSEAIERYAASNLTSLAAQIPQVAINEASSGNGAVITVRGVGSSHSDGGIDQEVTVNIDGIPISRGRVVTQASFDQLSVEVLKGPQALFFGKNSPAGVISINSVDPGQSFAGYARGGYAIETEEYFGEFALSAPVTDNLTMRLALRASRMNGGYIDNTSRPITNPAQLPFRLVAAGLTLPGSPFGEFPGSKDLIGRLTVKYAPTDRLDFTFKSLQSDHRDQGHSFTSVIFSCGPGQTGPTSADAGNPVAGSVLVDPYGTCQPGFRGSQGTLPAAVAAAYPGSNGGIPFTRTVSNLTSLTANYRLTDSLTLTSVSGYYAYTEKQWSNYDYTVFSAASGQNDDYWTALSQEIRLVSDFEGPLNVTAGVYYEDDDRKWQVDGMVAYRGPDPTTGRWDSAAALGLFTGKTYSAFGELNWKITPTIELAGGARYTKEEKTGDMRNTFVHSAYAATYLSPAIRLTDSFSEDNVSPQVTLAWHPQPDVMLFVAYRTGFKSGGYSSPTRYARTATATNQRFGQETVAGEEAGLKFSRGSLAGDFTTYRYTFKGLQLTAYNTVTTSYFIQNAGSADVYGVEGNMTYRATPELTLRGSVGYNHANYGSFPAAQCFTGQTAAEGCIAAVQNLSGQPLSRAPLWNAFLGASYDHPLSGDMTLSLSADARYSSGYFITVNNNPYGKQGDYTTVNASARLEKADWEFAIIGKNLTNELYAVLGGDKPLGPRGQVWASLGRPREIVLQVTRHF